MAAKLARDQVSSLRSFDCGGAVAAMAAAGGGGGEGGRGTNGAPARARQEEAAAAAAAAAGGDKMMMIVAPAPGEGDQQSSVVQVARPLAFRLASSAAACHSSSSPACHRVYPPPLARHEDVIGDPALFMDTLCKFHESMGSKMANPRMGGTQLDLYRLYQEVTRRGGLEQVIKEKLWKDIKAVFNFPRTTTSASFVLRKYYISLLHHYEQVYFFRNQGPLVTPPAPLPAPSPLLLSPEHCSITGDSPKQQKKHVSAQKGASAVEFSDPLAVDVGAVIGQTVTGSIEEKFEHGYLVTVVIGSEKFRGVIYQVPAGGSSVTQYTSMAAACERPEPETTVPGVRLRRKRRKLGLRRKDPNAPKLNRSGYNYFFAEQRAKLKLVHSDKDREISKMIGEAWSSMNEEQKAPYQEQGARDRERYRREIKDYRERQQELQVASVEGLGSLEHQQQPEQQSQQQHQAEQQQQQQHQDEQKAQQQSSRQQGEAQRLSSSSSRGNGDHDSKFHVSFNKPEIGLRGQQEQQQQQQQHRQQTVL